ncbi:MAG: hypothetical protein IPM82_14010 [Saprospiraceae bacterium]|nr:hypothetical protein [Saprospiraceae bacterium]
MKIKKANTGELVAIYDGIAFQHTFAKFGGYEFLPLRWTKTTTQPTPWILLTA